MQPGTITPQSGGLFISRWEVSHSIYGLVVVALCRNRNSGTPSDILAARGHLLARCFHYLHGRRLSDPFLIARHSNAGMRRLFLFAREAGLRPYRLRWQDVTCGPRQSSHGGLLSPSRGGMRSAGPTDRPMLTGTPSTRAPTTVTCTLVKAPAENYCLDLTSQQRRSTFSITISRMFFRSPLDGFLHPHRVQLPSSTTNANHPHGWDVKPRTLSIQRIATRP
jgi:hypothetical protein